MPQRREIDGWRRSLGAAAAFLLLACLGLAGSAALGSQAEEDPTLAVVQDPFLFQKGPAHRKKPKAKPASPAAKVSKHVVSGEESNLTALFQNPRLLRHHRYELLLSVVSKWSEALETVVSARAQADVAQLATAPQTFINYSPAVKQDEGTDLSGREVYLDYLRGRYRFKVGLQKFDWLETILPDKNDNLAIYDLRFALFDTSERKDIPVVAFAGNVLALGGTLDWFMTPLPEHHRLPVGINGYGFYENLTRTAAPEAIDVVDHPIPPNFNSSEYGLRYLTNISSVDMTLLAYSGHLRLAALTLTPSPLTGVTTIDKTYPQLTTYGYFAAIALDAWSFRFISLLEPNRPVAVQVATPVTPADATESRVRVGFGVDYVQSKAFKIYSEHYMDQYQGHEIPGTTRDYQSAIRMTNESFRDTELALDTVFFWPHFGVLLSPNITRTIAQDYKVGFGVHWVSATDTQSVLFDVKQANQVYLSLEHYFASNESQGRRHRGMRGR